MKSFAAASALLFASSAVAFPQMAIEKLARDAAAKPLDIEGIKQLESLHKRAGLTPPQGAGALPVLPPPFDAKSQLVSTTGEHAFVAPVEGDERGPCPGLNALANHGYIGHNGRGTIGQFVQAVGEVYGMSPELGLVLATAGAVQDGDGTSWSVGGQIKTGISGSHGNYESDSSPCRGDLFQYGNNEDLVMSQFDYLYALQPDAETANYNMDVVRDFRSHRLAESKAKNPYFAYSPAAGVLVSQAAHAFIYRLFANKTAEAPEGILNKDVLKSFMSISGPEDNLVWTPGYERIPDNWYKRNFVDEYNAVYLVSDILYFAAKYPEILYPGCNLGQVNSFNTITPEVLSNGAYTVSMLLSNPVCFATQFLKAEVSSLTGLDHTAVAPLIKVINDLGDSLACPPIGNANSSALLACPGFSSFGGPTAPAAPGAIQS